jgi:hypothetical protein
MAIGECGRVGAQLAEAVLVFKPPEVSGIVKAHPGAKALLGMDSRRRQQDKPEEHGPPFPHELKALYRSHPKDPSAI